MGEAGPPLAAPAPANAPPPSDGNLQPDDVGAGVEPVTRVRQDFPEAWIWTESYTEYLSHSLKISIALLQINHLEFKGVQYVQAKAIVKFFSDKLKEMHVT